MRYPLAPGVAWYAAGLLAAEWMHPPLWLLFAAAFTVALGALAWPRARGLLLWPLVALAAWTNLAAQTDPVSPCDLRRVVGEQAHLVTLRGVLRDTPEERVSGPMDDPRRRAVARLEVSALRRRHGTWEAAAGSVLAVTPGRKPAGFHAGQIVEVDGVLAPPPGPLAPGLFDYRRHLGRQGVHYLLHSENAEEWRFAGPEVDPGWSERFADWAGRTLARGLPEEDAALGLLRAMVLGWRTGVTQEVYRPFMLSGTLHVFAISGLHVALMTGILARLLLLARLGRRLSGVALLPAIWFYTAATGWQPSAVRSTIMMSIILGGWALRRPANLKNSLAAAALVILLWDPRQLFSAGFQLSFFVVLSLAFLTPPLERCRDWLLATDPMLPLQLVPRWRRAVTTGLRPVLTLATTSVAAWAGSLPLTAYYFNLVSPVALGANMVVVPMSGLALASSLGSLLCAPWAPVLTEWFNHGAWFWMRLMDRLSVAAAAMPGAVWNVRSPAPLEVAVYYAVLVAGAAGSLRWERTRWWLAGTLVAVGLCGATRACARLRCHELTVLPLNGGMAIYHRQGGGQQVLFDTGNARSAEFITRPFLRSRGVNQLDWLVLTHGDAQHVGGADLVAAEFDAQTVGISPGKVRSPVYRKVVAALETQGEALTPLGRGDRVAGWAVLHPDREDNFSRADDATLVARHAMGDIRVLMVSDLGRAGQEVLRRRFPDLRADILIGGLAGDGTTLGDALLDRVRPELVVVCDAEWPADARAPARLRQRLQDRGFAVVYLREAGTCSLRVWDHGWEAHTLQGRRWQGKLRGDF